MPRMSDLAKKEEEGMAAVAAKGGGQKAEPHDPKANLRPGGKPGVTRVTIQDRLIKLDEAFKALNYDPASQLAKLAQDYVKRAVELQSIFAALMSEAADPGNEETADKILERADHVLKTANQYLADAERISFKLLKYSYYEVTPPTGENSGGEGTNSIRVTFG